MSLLEINDVHGSYGLVKVLHGIDLTVPEGEVVAILGANGAGKTSLLRAINGVLPKRSGSIRFEGTEIIGWSPDKISRLGICQAPEGRGTFVELTVAENLSIGAWRRKDKQAIAADRDHVYDLFPVLADREQQRAGELSGGEQQMLAVARALLGGPRLLLLDEPSLGLAPLVVKQLYETLARVVTETGVTCVVVEQNAKAALGLATRGHLLEVGEIVRSGTAYELHDDDDIRRSYLGV